MVGRQGHGEQPEEEQEQEERGDFGAQKDYKPNENDNQREEHDIELASYEEIDYDEQLFVS